LIKSEKALASRNVDADNGYDLCCADISLSSYRPVEAE